MTPESDEVTEPITFRGHKGGVFGVAVSRTGKTILSISDDQNVLHYSPGERGKHGQLHRLGSPGVAVVLCNDDRDAVFCDGGEVVVYDVPGRKPRATFENPRGGIRSLAAAPDASFVLTGTTDGAVRWWNPKTKALEHTLDVDPKATVTAVAITPDARAAVFGLSDGRVCTWDLKGRKELKRWKAHAGSVTAVGYSPDGQRVVSAGEDGLGQIWTAAGSAVQKLAGHDGPVTGAAWLPDGRRVVTAGIDKRVRMWDQDKGWKVGWSADAGDRAFCLALDARGRFAAVGLADGAVRLLPLPKPGVPTGPLKDRTHAVHRRDQPDQPDLPAVPDRPVQLDGRAVRRAAGEEEVGGRGRRHQPALAKPCPQVRQIHGRPRLLPRRGHRIRGRGEAGPGRHQPGRPLLPISVVANAPLRVEQRTRKVDDGAGGLIERPFRFPVWFEPTAGGKTPMNAAVELATQIARRVRGRPPGLLSAAGRQPDRRPADRRQPDERRRRP